MALYDAIFDENTEYVELQANSAAEMQTLLDAWIADNQEALLLDIELNGTGAAPTFLLTLTVGEANGGVNPEVPQVQGIVIGGNRQLDTQEMAAAITEIISNASEGVYKVVSAGGGFGPHWMAVALIGAPLG